MRYFKNGCYSFLSHCELCSGKRAIKPTHHPLPHILLQFSHKSAALEHPAPLSHIITCQGQQMRLDGRLSKNIRPGKHLPGTGIHQYLPSFITMVLLAYSAITPMSWLIRIIVFPASFNIFIRARNLFRCPRFCPVVGLSSTIIPDSMTVWMTPPVSASGPGSVSAGALTGCC